MQTFLPHRIFENTFLLSANKTIFWEEEKILILSDLHLGKSGHFRKAGIAIPQNILQEDLFRLLSEIQSCTCRKGHLQPGDRRWQWLQGHNYHTGLSEGKDTK